MTQVLIYGIVGDPYDGLDAKTLVPLISAGSDDLDLRINSPGGFVVEGLAIFNAVGREKAKGRKVTTHIDGLAASMASVLAMAGDQILMADNALMMIHSPWDVAVGDAPELRRAADQLDLLRDQLVRIYSSQTGLDADTLIAMLNAETWLTSEQALEQKFVTQVVEASSAAACDVSAFGFRKAPETPRISAMAMIGKPKAAPAAPDAPQEKNMTLFTTRAALVAAIATFQTNGGTQDEIDKISRSAVALNALDVLPATGALAYTVSSGATGLTEADVQARADAAVAAERTRTSGIRALGTKHKLDTAFIDELVANNTTLAAAQEKILDKLAERDDAAGIGHNSPATVTQDARDKFREGATNWLLVRTGKATLVEDAARKRGETVRIDPGEFRGVTGPDLARESLALAGIKASSRNPESIVIEALSGGARGYQTRSDFPLVYEQVLHKILQAAYAITPDTWSMFCGQGTFADFRPTSIYRKGTFSALDPVNEHGEFKNKAIPDLAKETIQGKTVGNIVGLTRQAIIDDDLGIFASMVEDLGRSAKLTIEKDVYALINSNPTMGDGFALYSTQHGNLAATGAAPSVAAFDAIRVSMGSQMDVSGNDFMPLDPSIILAPKALGGPIRRINNAEFDPDVTSKFQVPNIVSGLYNKVIDTPRLTGTPYYAFADPSIAPALLVAFLNGVTEPFTEIQGGWRIDGTEWKVRHDYAVGAINYAATFKQPGA